MRRILYFSIILLMLLMFTGRLFSNSEEVKKEKKSKKDLPKIGSIYKYSKTDWYVRGVGDKVFEYKAVGESICIIVEGISGAIVKVPKKDDIVKIDPGVPMIYINNKIDKQLKANKYFMEKAKNKVFILLEYKK